jgi:adenosine deaminase
MVTVNSDDPAYFEGYINKNLIECQKVLNLSAEDVKKLAVNSFKSSFLDIDEKKKWIDQINDMN